jgi:POT family proton-dependent oligopeptide transporter
MFKNHPKGLLAAAFANMGERFGFYTMMAILTLFLMSKFGLSGTNAGYIYSGFYSATYVLAFVGGLIADKTKNFKRTILFGIILMTIGYFIIAIPTPTPAPAGLYWPFLILSCFGLLIIAMGNGLFKGNLQALVGQMYDDPAYSKMRDSGFSLFYMFINVGAIFAPIFAVVVRNWWINSHGFEYNANLSELCNGFLNNTLSSDAVATFQNLATSVGYMGTDLTAFANEYLNIFVTGFHYAFAVAIVAMLISLTIYITHKKIFPNPTVTKKIQGVENGEMSAQEIRQRLYALYAVFAVVIFFWFSFHQNGLTLTYFAKDYVDLSNIDINLGFTRLVGAELFQSINPFFVVFLTPVILAVFGALRARGKEPSTPKKIAIGMGIAAIAFLLMIWGSVGLPSKAAVTAMGGLPEAAKVTPFLMVGTYFILTVAELFISPLGISFVSKVAPPKYQGMMQGLWFCATGIGNFLLFIGAIFYEQLSLTTTWLLFVIVCLISMCIMLGMLKWLEKIAK